MDIYQYDEIEYKVMEHYTGGGGNVFYLGFPSLAKHYQILEGSRTDWTGYPGSGKTELLLECLKNTSEWYGHKHLLHMPDAGSIAELTAKLMHKMSGRQFKEFYYNKDNEKVLVPNRLTEEEVRSLLPQLLKNFVLFNPKGKASKAVTPSALWQFGADNKKELGIFSVVIDSWNYMNHDVPSSMRYDQWLESTLSFGNDLSEQSLLHFHTIIHPKSPTKIQGKVVIPDMHELKGGSEWANNGKSIIVCHRDFDTNMLDVKVNKAKPEIVGVRGFTNLFYNVQSGKYYEYKDGNESYATPLMRVQEVVKEINKKVAFAPNLDF